MKNKEELKKVQKIIELVKEKITNKELKIYILNNLSSNMIYRRFSKKDDNELFIYDKISKDFFSIRFNPTLDNFNNIEVKRSCWGRKRIESKNISYNEDLIIVEEETLDNCYYNNGPLSSISSDRMIRKYQNDMLIYKYQYSSEIYNELGNQRNYTIESEMYIDGINAMKKEITIKQEDAIGFDSGIRYSETNCYSEPYFNSSKNVTSVYIYETHEVSELEYNEFVKKFNVKQKQLTKV